MTRYSHPALPFTIEVNGLQVTRHEQGMVSAATPTDAILMLLLGKVEALLQRTEERLGDRTAPQSEQTQPECPLPVATDSAKAESESAETTETIARVNINTADAEALESLPLVGPATAKKIIDLRSQSPFVDLRDLVERLVLRMSPTQYHSLEERTEF